ncbi:hypothetical protein [Serratia symbiotica]|uniref:hypothetical protein n=1 Tax=Serratia symbiotica TaxID=138074 RepID=UPI001E32BDF3|nr:hypothetical protein [Serratia symbiotica]
MPNKRYLEASVVVEVDGETFSARATKTMDAGFSAFLKGEASDASDEDMPDSAFEVLQALRTGETGVAFFHALPESATLPDMTALWSAQQSDIEQGSKTVDEFVNTLIDD